MGSCLGHCRLATDSFSFYKFYSKSRGSVDIPIKNLANTESEEHIPIDSPSLFEKDEFGCAEGVGSKSGKINFGRLKSFFLNIKNKRKESSTLKLELLDDEWSITEADYSCRTESLPVPSSAKLKDNRSHNSASANSLDLEWDHLPEMAVFSSNLDKEEPKSATSAEAWSRLSSADSLEWDPVEIELKEDIDTETEQLLQEIEMLSSKTLQETQAWAS